MKENKDALDEINKGCFIGMDAIKDIIDKVDDKNFKKIIKKQYKEYEKINKKIEKLYKKYDIEGTCHETNLMDKVMTKYGIEIRTIMDKSNSKIAELLLKGTNMGIIEGRKILNKKQISKDVYDIISKYVIMQEENVENLKKYL